MDPDVLKYYVVRVGQTNGLLMNDKVVRDGTARARGSLPQREPREFESRLPLHLLPELPK